MTILDAVKPKEQSPERMYRAGLIRHDEYKRLKGLEKYELLNRKDNKKDDVKNE